MEEVGMQDLAAELIDVKIKIKELLDQERSLKEKIMPFIQKEGAVILEGGKVYYGESKGAETFSRKVVIDYLREGYGDAFADQVDQDCTKVGEPRQVVYVKLNK